MVVNRLLLIAGPDLSLLGVLLPILHTAHTQTHTPVLTTHFTPSPTSLYNQSVVISPVPVMSSLTHSGPEDLNFNVTNMEKEETFI